MNIWNKVLLGLIAAASLGFAIMAARTLQTHAYWMETAQKLEKSLGSVDEQSGVKGENFKLKAEVDTLRVELNKQLAGRPRVWANCDAKAKIDKAKGTATIDVTIESPAPHGMAANGTLYAFEGPSPEKPARYLGEFNVTKAADKQVTLEPAFPLGQLDMNTLADAKRPWILYESLPEDNHETFASMTDEQKKAVLPPDTQEEYAKDGKPATDQDPKERVKDGKYVRQLRDYAKLLNDAREQNTILFDQVDATKRDKALLDDALADAQRQVQYFQDLRDDKTNGLTVLKGKKLREVDAVGKLHKMLEDKLVAIAEAVERMIQENKAMAGQIAKDQWEATRRIDARTRAMAANASGEK